MHCLQADTLPFWLSTTSRTQCFHVSFTFAQCVCVCQPKPVPIFMGSVSNQTPEAGLLVPPAIMLNNTNMTNITFFI